MKQPGNGGVNNFAIIGGHIQIRHLISSCSQHLRANLHNHSLSKKKHILMAAKEINK